VVIPLINRLNRVVLFKHLIPLIVQVRRADNHPEVLFVKKCIVDSRDWLEIDDNLIVGHVK
jgi:hypothetical protein